MASERLKRQIDGLLDEVEAAVSQLDWLVVRDRTQAVLALDPENADAATFLAAAERALSGSVSIQQPLSNELSSAPSSLPSRDMPGSFSNGRYEVQRLLGEGGKKKVYLALDTLLDREVAFALIKTEGLDDIARARITREAQAMGRLGNHPHIVTVFDLGEENGQPYMVTELMAGGDVESLIDSSPERRLSTARSVSITQEVCRGLEYAHSRGVVHRDLKPGNVWLTGDGLAKIGDLGLAVVLDRSRLTQTAMIVGTVSYMPPEQAMGGEVSPQSDLYSLGAMLYEMVTGRPPFVGEDSMAVIGQHINTPPVAPTWHNPQCPRRLEALILRLLAKDPKDRPESATDVLTALEDIDTTPTNPSSTQEALQPEAAPASDALAAIEYMGMQREVRELRAALEDSLSGRGRLIMMMGDAGIGKTRTAQELATYAGLRGAQILWGRCYRESGMPPYWPWIQVIRSYVQVRDEERLRSEMGAGAVEIAGLVSEVREKIPGLAEEAPLGNLEQARFRLFDAITTFLKTASHQQPILVILDDLHWADQPTISLLQFVARELRGARLLLLGTYQDVELSLRHPLSQALGELTRERLFQRVSLPGLNRGDVENFIEAASGNPPPQELVDVVFRQTEGNPLFVTEVVRSLLQEGALTEEAAARGSGWSVRIPQGVREVIGRRLDPLSEGSNQVLTVAAVIGREFTLELLGHLVDDTSSNRLLEIVEEALAARILEELPQTVGRYRFTHALIQETLLEEMSMTRRVRLHAVISEVMERLYGNNTQEHAAEIAYHLSEAMTMTGAERLVHFSVLAGERALDVHDPEDALVHFNRAAEAKERQPSLAGSINEVDAELASIMFGLGRAQLATLERRQMREAVASLSRALDYYIQCRDVPRAVAVGEYPLPPLPGQRVGLTQLVARALAMIPADSHEAGGLLSRYGRVIGIEEGDYEGAQEISGRALAIAQREGDLHLELRTLTEAAYVDIFHVQFQKSLEKSEKAIELARRLEDTAAEMYSHIHAASSLIYSGDRERARLHAAGGLELAEKLRDRFWLSTSLSGNMDVARLQGDWGTARSFGVRGLAVATLDPRILSTQAMIEYEVGDFTQGSAHVEQLLEAMRLTIAGPNYEYACLSAVIPAAARITGELDKLDIAEQAAEAVLASPSASPYLAIQARIGLAWLSVLRADSASAAEQYEAIEPVRGTFMAVGGIACSDRLLGLLAHVAGRIDDAIAHFEDGLGFCRRAGYRPEYSWVASDYADLLLERSGPGDRPKAISMINETLQIVRSLGMTPLMDRLMSHGLHTERLSDDDDRSAVAALTSETTIQSPIPVADTDEDASVTVMFIDIEDFGAMSEKLGPEQTRDVLDAYTAVVREQVAVFGGSEVKSIRDGYMLAFPSPVDALRSAVAIQRAYADYNSAHPEEPVRVRMGLNTREASRESEEVIGNDFIVAARIADLAQGGSVLISPALKEVAESSGEFTFDGGRDLDLEDLPGLNRVYEVMWLAEG